MRDEQPLNYSNRLLPALPPTQPLPAHPPAPEVGSAGEGVAPNLSPQLVLHNLVGALHAPLALGVPNRAADVPDAVHLAQLVEMPLQNSVPLSDCRMLGGIVFSQRRYTWKGKARRTHRRVGWPVDPSRKAPPPAPS